MIPEILNIIQVQSLGEYRLEITFDNQTVRIVDFFQFLDSSVHPDIRKWLDPKFFSGFRIEYGELIWGDYELCFPICDLYTGEIIHNQRFQEAI